MPQVYCRLTATEEVKVVNQGEQPPPTRIPDKKKKHVSTFYRFFIIFL